MINPSFDVGRGNSAIAPRGEWESSFQQIVDRTKHNLNRINQKYAPRTGTQSASSAGKLLKGSENVLRQSNSGPASLLHEKFLARSAALSATQRQQLGGDEFGEGDENLSGVLQRLERLEEARQQQVHHAADGGSKVAELERTVQSLLGAVEQLQAQSKDSERAVHQLQQRVDRVQSCCDALQEAHDSRKHTMSKLDSWVRQVSADGIIRFIPVPRNQDSIVAPELPLLLVPFVLVSCNAGIAAATAITVNLVLTLLPLLSLLPLLTQLSLCACRGSLGVKMWTVGWMRWRRSSASWSALAASSRRWWERPPRSTTWSC